MQHKRLINIAVVADCEQLFKWQLDVILNLQKQPSHSITIVHQTSSTLSTNVFLRLLRGFDQKLFCKHAEYGLPIEFSALTHDFSAIDSDTDCVIDLNNSGVTAQYSADIPCISIIHHAPNVTDWHTVALNTFAENALSVRTEILLQQQQQSEVLFSTVTSIDEHSIIRTEEALLNKMTIVLPRTLSRWLNSLHDQANSTLKPTKAVDNTRATEHQSTTPQKPLSLWQSVKLNVRFFSRFAKIAYLHFTHDEQWFLLVGKNTEDGQPNFDLHDFERIFPPKENFWADPFVLEHQGKQYCFFEDLPYARDLGHLSVMELLPEGGHTEPVKILEREYHLSFPNVFEYEGQFYMVPESSENHSIELWRAEQFPYRWSFDHYLMQDVEAVDCNFFEHEGRWWMFATMWSGSGMSPNEELHLFSADSPLSTNWQPHPANPVISDARTARPAGNIFIYEGDIIRPSQDCEGVYGSAINFNKVEVLNAHEYKESRIKRLAPEWSKSIFGLHTFNHNNKYTVSDAIHHNRKF